VAILTNGNVFSLIGLADVLALHRTSFDLDVTIVTGLRRQKGNRYLEAAGLLRRWGLAYFAYKLTSLALPRLRECLTGRPMTVAAACRQLGIPCRRVRNANVRPCREHLQDFRPDLLLSFSCPHRIKPSVLSIARVGNLNVHSSLLPRYAGVCTYIHVLADGCDETGVTIHEMVEDFDAGRIVAQERLAIHEGMSVLELFTTQCRTAARMLPGAIGECIRSEKIVGEAQVLAQRSYCGEPTRADIARLRRRGHRLARLREWVQFSAQDRPGESPVSNS
jgi:methionyl-tRNA formyltransferase